MRDLRRAIFPKFNFTERSVRENYTLAYSTSLMFRAARALCTTQIMCTHFLFFRASSPPCRLRLHDRAFCLAPIFIPFLHNSVAS